MKLHCEPFDSHCGVCREQFAQMMPFEQDQITKSLTAPAFPAIKKSDKFIGHFIDTLKIHRRFFIPTPDGKPYMERISLKDTPEEKVYLHILYASDGDRDPHDHPWDFTSRIIYGTYVEHTPIMDPVTGKIIGYNQETFDHVVNNVNEKKAEALHRLELPFGPVVTLVTRGPRIREWGFYTDEGWMASSVYLRAKGFDPGEDYE